MHDWFLAHDGIDRVHLTVEPVRFGDGLPVFRGQKETDPVAIFRALGFAVAEERMLNDKGTAYYVLTRDHGIDLDR